MSVEIHTPSPDVVVPEKPLLRMHQREAEKQEIEGIQGMLQDLRKPSDRAAVSQRLKRLEKSLNDQSPDPTISDVAKNRLYAESKAIEKRIAPYLLTQEEMRKNPAGSVGRYMRGEGSPAVKKDILKWKNIQLMLDPTSNDPDLANFEKHRPEGATGRFRTDAQITGHMSYSDIPQEQWNQVFPPQEKPLSKKQAAWTPEKRAKQAEIYRKKLAERRARQTAKPSEVS